MGYTISEKILLSRLKGKKDIRQGEAVTASIDFCYGNDLTSPRAFQEFRKLGRKKVFNNARIGLIPYHFQQSKDAKIANHARLMKEFAGEYNIKNYFEAGDAGIEHILVAERGLILPGDVVIGADSRACTGGALGALSVGVGSTDLAYALAFGEAWFKVPETIKIILHGKPKKWVGGKDIILKIISDLGITGALGKTIEIAGPTMEYLSMDDRLGMCNMAAEIGIVNAIIEPDKITEKYVKDAIRKYKPSKKTYKFYKSDNDAIYKEIKEYNVSKLEPLVAVGPSVSDVKPISEVKDIKVDEIFIGSSANGSISDLKEAAAILKNRRVSPGARLIVAPATPQIYKEAVKEGYAEVLIKAGAVLASPTSWPGETGHYGILPKGESTLSTINTIFSSKAGNAGGVVYVANTAIAAATAIKGKISHPSDL